MGRGDYQVLDGTWQASAATSTDNNIFVVSNGALYWIAGKAVGRWGQLDGSWDTVTMAGVGDKLLLWERSNTVYRMMTRANTWTQLTTTYANPVCSTSLLGKLRVREGNALYSVDPDDAAYTMYDGSWNATQLVGIGESIYIFDHDGALYRLGVNNTGYSQLEGSWPETMAATAHGGRIFAVNDGALYDIDPATGSYQKLDGSWSSTHLVSCAGKLYSFEASGALYCIEV